MNASTSAGVSGPVIAAVITGFIALMSVAWNQYQTRQDARRKDFAEALAAVERYAELPYRIRRRQDSTPEVETSPQGRYTCLYPVRRKSWQRASVCGMLLTGLEGVVATFARGELRRSGRTDGVAGWRGNR